MLVTTSTSVIGSELTTSPKKLSLSPLLVSARKARVRSFRSTVNAKLLGAGTVPPSLLVVIRSPLLLPAMSQYTRASSYWLSLPVP